jgi:hypothetical protein
LKYSLFLFPLMILIFSCKEEELSVYDKLDKDEQEAIRRMGQDQCLSKSKSIFDRYKKESNTVFTSSAYEREDGYYFVLKKDSTEEKTVDIQVWKQTPTAIYFYIIDSRAADNYFLRITKAENEQMIDDLLTAHCTRPNIYDSKISNSGPASFLNEYRLPRTPNDEVYEDRYTLSFKQLAYFANFNIKRTRKYKDEDDRQVGNSENFTSSLKAKAVDFDTNDWSDTSKFTQKFCKISRGVAYRFVRERNLEGFKVDLSNAADCTNTKPADWNLNI